MGTYDLIITNGSGVSVTKAGAYSVKKATLPDPIINSINKTVVPASTRSIIVIEGENFSGAMVMVGTSKGTIINSSSTQIEVKVPGLKAGSYDIVVTNSNGKSVKYSTQITYQ